MPRTYKPGERSPVSAQVEIVGPRGGRTGQERTVVQGEPMPPIAAPKHPIATSTVTRSPEMSGRTPPERLNPRSESGTPGGIRTPNPQFRRLMLYPLSYGRWCAVNSSFLPPLSGDQADAR
jgi:hypothetical protein